MTPPSSTTTMAPSFAPSQHGEDGGSRRQFVVKGHWKPSEDVKLRELVALHGPKNWNMISEQLPGRTGKSCRLRWVNQLDPRIKTAIFSREEDETLMAAHMVFGNQWSHIAKFFPGRTDNGIKNHWHVLTSRRRKNVAGISSSSSFGSFYGVSGDSTSCSCGSTITRLGKSNVINDGTSLLCVNTPDSAVFRAEEIKTSLAAASGRDGGYFNNKMKTSGGYMIETCTNSMTPESHVSLVYPPDNSNSNTATSHYTADGTIMTTPPPFIDFLGIGT